VRRLPECVRTRLGVTLPNEGLKMADDAELLIHHN
jgi:hypothetical protein